jgi:hypothetical protein
MKMKKQKNENRSRLYGLPFLSIALFFLFFLYSANTYARDIADFSGEWTLNEDESEMGESRFGPSKTLKITQAENSLVIESTRVGRDGETRKIKDEYTLDGEEKLTENERGTTKTIASWSEDSKTLSLKSHRKMTRDDQTFEITTEESWELSDKGSTLTINTSRSSPRGESSSVLVYSK